MDANQLQELFEYHFNMLLAVNVVIALLITILVPALITYFQGNKIDSEIKAAIEDIERKYDLRIKDVSEDIKNYSQAKIILESAKELCQIGQFSSAFKKYMEAIPLLTSSGFQQESINAISLFESDIKTWIIQILEDQNCMREIGTQISQRSFEDYIRSIRKYDEFTLVTDHINSISKIIAAINSFK